MPLILAIDSDRRQSEQLAALMRSRLKVELVQATSAGEGLHALNDRIPDLILTSPLLSPFDDGVLDEYLRELGTQAAHVQTVRIPVLSAVAKPSARALFSLRRKKTPSTAPDGCDPKMFADEIAQYLTRAQERRAAKTASPANATSDDVIRALEIETPALPPIEAAAREEDDPIVRDFASMPAEDEENDDAVYQSAPTIQTFDIPEEPESVALAQPMSILNLAPPRVIEQPKSEEPQFEEHRPFAHEVAPVAVSRAIVSEPDRIVVPDPPMVRADAEPLAPSRSIFFNEPIHVALTPEPIHVAQAPEPIQVTEAPEPIQVMQAPQPLDVVGQADVSDEPAADLPRAAAVERTVDPGATQSRPVTAPITSFETALAAIRAAWAGPASGAPGTSISSPRPLARDTGPSLTREVKATDATSPADVHAAPAPTSDRPVQVEVDLTGDIDALDDIDRQQSHAEELPTDDPAARRRSPKARKTPAQTPTVRTANGGPVQDEWGIFDPNQCGFSALVDKLDEVADPHDHPERTTKVRVISVG